jgi:PhzF family phenazine biosynthesis protein
MAAFANWTNLSETTFLLTPTHPDADYRVRIFTPQTELPFAGHPTLGTAHVWLAQGGKPKQQDIIQECAAGLIRLRQTPRLAFAAPPTQRTPVQPETLAQIARALRIPLTAIRQSQHVSRKPDWVAVQLASRDEVLALKPDFPAMGTLEIGVFAACDIGGAQFEVRAFAPADGVPEDPVTGSLNAGLAQWLIADGMAPETYIAAQGTVLGRAGRVYVERIGADIWVGGDVVTRITGTLTL